MHRTVTVGAADVQYDERGEATAALVVYREVTFTRVVSDHLAVVDRN
jgi:deoxyinosine 3'endonuclease (endonuclease V)